MTKHTDVARADTASRIESSPDHTIASPRGWPANIGGWSARLRGRGGPLFGVGKKVPVESYVPMMMFAIVFGLSMDYEVFLLSRVREPWLATRDNHASVAAGLGVTARVISCAALIMTSVCLAFLLSNDVVVKMLALGLGVSVLIDASIVRLVIVPSTLFLLDKANWWIPGRLDRVLPHPGEKSVGEPA